MFESLLRMFKPRRSVAAVIRPLVLDRCLHDPANRQAAGSRESVEATLRQLPDGTLVAGSPEGAIFTLCATYKDAMKHGLPPDLTITHFVDRPHCLHRVGEAQRAAGRELTDEEVSALIEAHLADLPDPLTLRSYVVYRILSVPNPSISEPYVLATIDAAVLHFGIEEEQ